MRVKLRGLFIINSPGPGPFYIAATLVVVSLHVILYSINVMWIHALSAIH